MLDNMKINSALVLQLRNARSWSQEELAIATGLNLRTVQRIEAEASASLQSKKALAAVFEIDIKTLDFKGSSPTVRYEYKTLNISVKRGFLSGITNTPLPNLVEIFNEEGGKGWRPVQILTPDVLSSAGKATETWVALLERPIVGN